jgi:hypothetical protein
MYARRCAFLKVQVEDPNRMRMYQPAPGFAAACINRASCSEHQNGRQHRHHRASWHPTCASAAAAMENREFESSSVNKNARVRERQRILFENRVLEFQCAIAPKQPILIII